MSTTDVPAPRRIEYLPLDDLKVNPRNPKDHNLELIDESVGRFGFMEPIIRDDRTGYIISGHGRRSTLASMRDRGEDIPEGVTLADDGTWLVPVGTGWASRTDSEANAALIALNRTTELGGWVDDSLLELLDDLSTSNAGFDGVGFGEDDLEALRRKIEANDYMESIAGGRKDSDDAHRDDEADAEFDENIPIDGQPVTSTSFHSIRVSTENEADTRALFALLGIEYVEGEDAEQRRATIYPPKPMNKNPQPEWVGEVFDDEDEDVS